MQSSNNNSADAKALKLRILTIIFSTISQKPDRLSHLEVDKEFLESLNLTRMLKSSNPEERELSLNFCILLLHQEKKVTMSDLVQYDMETRDILSKGEMRKMWESMNEIGSKVGSNATLEALGKTGVAKPLESQNTDMEKMRRKMLTEIEGSLEQKITQVNDKIEAQESVISSL